MSSAGSATSRPRAPSWSPTFPGTTPSALVKSPAKIGSITVTFAAAWAENARPPADEDGTRQATESYPARRSMPPMKPPSDKSGDLRGGDCPLR